MQLLFLCNILSCLTTLYCILASVALKKGHSIGVLYSFQATMLKHKIWLLVSPAKYMMSRKFLLLHTVLLPQVETCVLLCNCAVSTQQWYVSITHALTKQQKMYFSWLSKHNYRFACFMPPLQQVPLLSWNIFPIRWLVTCFFAAWLQLHQHSVRAKELQEELTAKEGKWRQREDEERLKFEKERREVEEEEKQREEERRRRTEEERKALAAEVQKWAEKEALLISEVSESAH